MKEGKERKEERRSRLNGQMKTSARSGIRCRVRRGIVGIQIESLSSSGYLEWKYKEDSPRIDRTCERQFNKLHFILFFFFQLVTVRGNERVS